MELRALDALHVLLQLAGVEVHVALEERDPADHRLAAGASHRCAHHLVGVQPLEVVVHLGPVRLVLLDQVVEQLARVGQLLVAVVEAAPGGVVDRLAVRLDLPLQRLQRGSGAGDVGLGLREPIDRGLVAIGRQRDVLEALPVPLGAGELRAQVRVGEAHVEADGGDTLLVELVDQRGHHPPVPGEAAEPGDGRLVDRGDDDAPARLRTVEVGALLEAQVDERLLDLGQERDFERAAAAGDLQDLKTGEKEARVQADAERVDAPEPAPKP